jgi:endonuclease/exonuclease/phosphatase family metal-dependent hydrolase
MNLKGQNITVMTWNLFLGAEIEPVLKVGFGDQELLAKTAARVWDEVLANDFRDRAVAIVDAIQATMPDLIGLQEVARFRSRITEPATDEVIATKTLDYQRILQEELRARRLPYSFAEVVENTRAAAPVDGLLNRGRFVPTQQVELTMRDAVLVRDTVQVVGASKGHYRAGVPVGKGPSGPAFEMIRGWIKLQANVGGFPVQFVNTHLETQPHCPVQLEQTRELLAEVVPDRGVTTILVGDFNSDAAASPAEVSWTPTYGELTAASFVDTFAVSDSRTVSDGYTCCHGSDLRDLSTSLDQRIDFIFVRGPWPTKPGREGPPEVVTEVIGRGPEGRISPGERWPSDHAGLVATLSFSRFAEPPEGQPPLPSVQE